MTLQAADRFWPLCAVAPLLLCSSHGPSPSPPVSSWQNRKQVYLLLYYYIITLSTCLQRGFNNKEKILSSFSDQRRGSRTKVKDILMWATVCISACFNVIMIVLHWLDFRRHADGLSPLLGDIVLQVVDFLLQDAESLLKRSVLRSNLLQLSPTADRPTQTVRNRPHLKQTLAASISRLIVRNKNQTRLFVTEIHLNVLIFWTRINKVLHWVTWPQFASNKNQLTASETVYMQMTLRFIFLISHLINIVSHWSSLGCLTSFYI